ncbi:ABC transporter permease [Schaalia sp. 19OD2882]|uniref:ABC transporter permease n=1 Tax=Schaalia sp. 19OD2882 TaxID=2794089 RepID=UPI001C1EC42F|nr:ABC transporter permease [Schaalia sp. 19OD2882]QWW19738.1 ABC transporter permease [Schaalia sp. 19OD2882]
MLVALDLGLIYGLMALGVYLTFRVLDFADLTVDGSFTTGAAVTAVMITNGLNPWVSTFAGFAAGFTAGTITGLLNTKGQIHPLLAGILTQIALYSINLRIMGKANLPLLRGVDTLVQPLRQAKLLGSWTSVAVFAAVIALVMLAFNWFLSTQVGLGMRATGDNEGMARAQGVNTGAMKVLGLALSNGLVGLCGSIVAQYQGVADISMGIGLIVAGLASVIIGTAIIGSPRVWVMSLAVVIGSLIYRGVIQVALTVPGFDANDMKLLSAVIVLAALLLPRWGLFARIRAKRRSKTLVAEPDIVPPAEEADSTKAVL